LDKILHALSSITFHPFEPKEEDECKSYWPGWKELLLLPLKMAPPQNIAPYSNNLPPSAFGAIPAAEIVCPPVYSEEDECKRPYSMKKEC
jgi:hypothetical protein